MQVSVVLLVLSSALLQLPGCFTTARERKILKNDATEILPEYRENTRTPQEATNGSNDYDVSSMNNRAKNGGKSANTVPLSASEMSCRERRLTRYITDGFCRSAKPVKELVCSGQCMPARLMPNSITRGKWWRSNASDYRCIPAHYRTRRVQLHCPNGNTRTYKIRMVTSCKCKRFRPQHNQSEAKEIPKRQRNKKHSRLSEDRSRNDTPSMGNSF